MFTISNGTSKVTCDSCGKETLTVEKAGNRPRKTRLAVREAKGWTWVSAKVQLGPKCKGKAAEFEKAAKAEKKSKPEKKAKAPVAKKATAPKTGKPNGSRGGISTDPITDGQSIGKLARTAKVSAAPPAE